MIDDPMDAQLALLDPARREAPPAPGSVRHASILERAMSATDRDTATLAPLPEPRSARRRHRWRPYAATLAAAVAVAVVAGAALLPRGAGSPDAVSLVSSAAGTTAKVTSLRVSIEHEDQYSSGTGSIEISGNRMRVQVNGTYSDGHTEGSTTVYLGLVSYQQNLDGGTETDRRDRPLPPFVSSSEAVLDAALSGQDVAVVGQETVRDVPATHYRITLDATARAALAGVDPEKLAWFDLENPDQVRTVDVWVGDDLVRRLRVTGDDGSVRSAEYYDFGADIRIQAPDWAGIASPGEG
ncbi:MAG TPA: hypothetical protein VH479_23260 [Acidimicrobiales bacterium]